MVKILPEFHEIFENLTEISRNLTKKVRKSAENSRKWPKMALFGPFRGGGRKRRKFVPRGSGYSPYLNLPGRKR